MLSRLQAAPERYEAVFLSVLEKLALIFTPLAVLLFSTGDWFVELALGPQWLQAASCFRVFSVYVMVQPLTTAVVWVFTSQGRANLLFKWGIVRTIFMVLTIIVGLFWGPFGVALAFVAASILIEAPAFFWLAGRVCSIRTRDYYAAIWSPTCAAMLLLGALCAWRGLARPNNCAGSLVVAIAGSLLVYPLSLLAFPRGRACMSYCVNYLRGAGIGDLARDRSARQCGGQF